MIPSSRRWPGGRVEGDGTRRPPSRNPLHANGGQAPQTREPAPSPCGASPKAGAGPGRGVQTRFWAAVGFRSPFTADPDGCAQPMSWLMRPHRARAVHVKWNVAAAGRSAGPRLRIQSLPDWYASSGTSRGAFGRRPTSAPGPGPAQRPTGVAYESRDDYSRSASGALPPGGPGAFVPAYFPPAWFGCVAPEVKPEVRARRRRRSPWQPDGPRPQVDTFRFPYRTDRTCRPAHHRVG